MKTQNKDLFLIRHAEAEEKEPGQKDIDRILNVDGIQVATKTGHYFNRSGIQPDIIITSPAARAHTTAILIAEQLKFNTEQIYINDELYEASVRILLQVVNRLKNTWNKVFIVAHNPTISYLVEYITREELSSLAAGGFAHIKVGLNDWEEVSEGNGTLAAFTDPSTYNF